MAAGLELGKAGNKKPSLDKYFYLLFSLFALCCGPGTTSAQRISMPNQPRWAFSVRGGMLSNNGDLAAVLHRKNNYDSAWSVNTNYTLAYEAILGFDLIRLRGTDICLHVSGLYSEPELMAEGAHGKFRAGLTQLGIVRGSLTFSFNSDGYKMFGMPYHVNHEAVLGITTALMYAMDPKLTQLAKDSLGITAIKGQQFCKAIGLTFGWNWRIADSGWIISLNGSIMWYADDKIFMAIKTDENSWYNPANLTFAPRLVEAGIGYHF